MIKKALSIISIAVFLLAGLIGCNNGTDDSGSASETVKSKADYQTEAQKEITKENMDQQLDNIEKALAEEESSGQ